MSTEIPSPPLALFIVMLLKAHLTLDCRMSGSRLVIFLWQSGFQLVLHPACMYSAYKLNKQGDNIQPWRTPLPILNQSIFPCLVLTVVSWPAGKVMRYSHCLKNFPQFVVIHTVKGFRAANETEEFFWNSLAFSMIQHMLAIWFLVLLSFQNPALKFSVHVLLKPNLDHFEQYFARVWDEHNCAVVWTIFGIAFLWDWNENWPFPVLWPLLNFPNLLAYCKIRVQHFHSIIF